jgi:hypothetical protein
MIGAIHREMQACVNELNMLQSGMKLDKDKFTEARGRLRAKKVELNMIQTKITTDNVEIRECQDILNAFSKIKEALDTDKLKSAKIHIDNADTYKKTCETLQSQYSSRSDALKRENSQDMLAERRMTGDLSAIIKEIVSLYGTYDEKTTNIFTILTGIEEDSTALNSLLQVAESIMSIDTEGYLKKPSQLQGAARLPILIKATNEIKQISAFKEGASGTPENFNVNFEKLIASLFNGDAYGELFTAHNILNYDVRQGRKPDSIRLIQVLKRMQESGAF